MMHPEGGLKERLSNRHRASGTGRIAKRRPVLLKASWTTLDAPHALHAGGSADGERAMQQQPSATITCVSTMLPTGPNLRRSRLTSTRRAGTGRSTQLRSFTLHLTLPAAALAPQAVQAALTPHAAAIMRARMAQQQLSGTPSNSTLPGLSPMEGIPERMATAARRRRSAQTPGALPARTPAAGPAPSSSAAGPPTTGGTSRNRFNWTPCEGVPERALPPLPGSSKLARLVGLPAWAPPCMPSPSPLRAAMQTDRRDHHHHLLQTEQLQEEEEAGLFLHRASDEVLLKSAACSPAPALAVLAASLAPHAAVAEAAVAGAAECVEALIPPALQRSLDASAAAAGAGGGSCPTTPLDRAARAAAAAEDEAAVAAQAADDDDDFDNGGMLQYDDGGCEEEQQHAGAEDPSSSRAHEQQQQQQEEEGREQQQHAGSSDRENEAPAAPGPCEGSGKGGAKAGREAPKKRDRASEHRRHSSMEDMRRRKSLAGDGLRVDEANGQRRSTRQAQRPLEFWRNEKKVFGRDHKSLPTVVGVETKTPNPYWPLSNKAGKKKARTKA